MRGQLQRSGRWSALAESLTGLEGDVRAELTWQRLQGIKEAHAAMLTSLAGRDDSWSWTQRTSLEAPKAALARSLTGLDSDRAWAERLDPAMRSRANSDALGMSMAGLDSDKAWALRYELLAEGKSDPVALSLAGLDSKEAWTMRRSLLGQAGSVDELTFKGLSSDKARALQLAMEQGGVKVRPGLMAQSLGGLHTDEASAMRQELAQGTAPEPAIAKSLNGNWMMAAIKLHERQRAAS